MSYYTMLTEGLTARDLRTIAPYTLTPYGLGYNDAYYQRTYYCPWPAGTPECEQYQQGHEDGMEATCFMRNVGG
jgi:hypothetical protein